MFVIVQGPVLDVEWRDDEVFASCSTDKSIIISKINQKEVIRKFEGHIGEINTVMWSPDGRYLASCSDDKTAKVRFDTTVNHF